MQHPTLRFIGHDMFASLRRWTGMEVPSEEPSIDNTVAAMDSAGVDFGLITTWSAPHQPPLISNDEVAGGGPAHPDHFHGLAAQVFNKPMEAVRELRLCLSELGFRGL